MNVPTSPSQARPQVSPEHPPACPVCGGPLVPLNGCSRCSRCGHPFCDSCAGEVVIRDEVRA
jgi:hypothetical protein